MYKKRRLAVMIGMLAGSTSVFAQTDMTSIESRLAALEQRLQDAEMRAQNAEKRATAAEQKIAAAGCRPAANADHHPGGGPAYHDAGKESRSEQWF